MSAAGAWPHQASNRNLPTINVIIFLPKSGHNNITPADKLPSHTHTSNLWKRDDFWNRLPDTDDACLPGIRQSLEQISQVREMREQKVRHTVPGRWGTILTVCSIILHHLLGTTDLPQTHRCLLHDGRMAPSNPSKLNHFFLFLKFNLF